MIKIENVSKSFNRRKKNEVKAVKNISLTFEESGLVSFLGPSGCGKTTLLNLIGGLDKVNKGNIFINGKKITRKSSRSIDSIRNLNIGYIFQNYNLLDDKTVFENVAMVLNMVGIKNAEEVREKVNYALEMVNMYRYRNRYTNMLSGGERQRVAIARAIVKNPAIIIADEPTGNLDSKNSLAIMNIIKKISKEKLVILVTHEEKLAKFYSDRIIKIKDGELIFDGENNNTDGLDYRVENKIYLKDIENHAELTGPGYKIDFYKENSEDIKLNIVALNGNIYIQCDKENVRAEMVNQDSNIELLQEHYEEIKQEDIEKDRFDITKFKSKKPLRNASIFNLFTILKEGFRKVMGYNTVKKILLLGFFVSAMFILLSVSNIFGVLKIDDEKFVSENQNYVEIKNSKITVEEYEKYEQNKTIKYLLPGDSTVSLQLVQDEYLQTSHGQIEINASLSSTNYIKQKDLIYGEMPQNPQEIVLDKMAVDTLINNETAKATGITSPEKIIGKKLKVPNMKPFIVTGITDKSSPCLYTGEENFIDIIANSSSAEESGQPEENGQPQETAMLEEASGVLNFDLKKDEVFLKRGSLPTNDYEAVVNISKKDEMPLKKEIGEKVNGRKLKVVGYYDSKYSSNFILVNSNTIKYKVITKSKNAMAYSENKKETINSLEENGVVAKDTYEKSREEYKSGIWSNIWASIILASVVLGIAIIEIFLIMRASFISRVKEVGTYRAIGVKKTDIYKMFIGEIIAITTIGSLPGYLFMAYIIKELSTVKYFAEVYLFDGTVLLFTIVLIYALNIVFGLIPVFNTLRKTPAAILARNDVN